MARTLRIIKDDPWLKPYEQAIAGRYAYALQKEKELCGDKTLSDVANGHLYFGLHRTDQGWVFREWAPHATAIALIGDFNQWQENDRYALSNIGNGIWEVKLEAGALQHGQHYKMLVKWEGGCGERIPAWATRVVQDNRTHVFSAQVWAPEQPYRFRRKRPARPKDEPLLIYECHIGMATE